MAWWGKKGAASMPPGGVDLEELRRSGYLVLPHTVPPEQLAPLRAHCEAMLQRHRGWWREHTNGKPIALPDIQNGQTEFSPQPRVLFDRVVDPEHADIVDFMLGPTTHGVTHALMSGGDPQVDVMPLQMAMLTNPTAVHSSWDWHRDFNPENSGPLEGLSNGFLLNAPAFLQWNVALFDVRTSRTPPPLPVPTLRLAGCVHRTRCCGCVLEVIGGRTARRRLRGCSPPRSSLSATTAARSVRPALSKGPPVQPLTRERPAQQPKRTAGPSARRCPCG